MPAVAIIQARMGSRRLPGKTLLPLLGRPMLWHIVERVRAMAGLDGVVVATSKNHQDAPIREFCRDHAIPVFAGSEEDVLDRFYQAARVHQADPIVRITADCPFVDPGVLSRLLQSYREGEYDEVGVATGAGALFETCYRFPDGLDAECIRQSALERAWEEATDPSDREHVTPYLWRVPGRFRIGRLFCETDCSWLRWTVDNREDFAFVTRIYEALYRPERHFQMEDILEYLQAHPGLVSWNRHFIGEEGYEQVWKPGRERV